LFRGVNIVSLDAKGRFAMPTRYREELAACCSSKLVATVDKDRCLLIYPFPEWEEIERKLVKLPSYNRQTRDLQRLLVGYATELDMDNNGRLLLTSPLRNFAGLDKKAVLIGQGNKFELWDEEVWNKKCDQWFEEGGMDSDSLPPEMESLSL
jgi:MraZ protein